jgi:hypothetical protein
MPNRVALGVISYNKDGRFLIGQRRFLSKNEGKKQRKNKETA